MAAIGESLTPLLFCPNCLKKETALTEKQKSPVFQITMVILALSSRNLQQTPSLNNPTVERLDSIL